jgi:hypothetical protein
MSFYTSGQSAEMIINGFKHKVYTRAPIERKKFVIDRKPKNVYTKPLGMIEDNIEMHHTTTLALKTGALNWRDVPTGVSTGIDLGVWAVPEWHSQLPLRGMNYERNVDSHIKFLKKNFKPIKKGKSKMYYVQLIAGHRVYKSSPEVLVKWYGYEYPTWEAFANVKHTANAQEYAKDEGLTFKDNCIVVKIDDEVSEEIV